MSELCECPWCKDGGFPEVITGTSYHYDSGWASHVECQDCLSCGPIRPTKQEAIAAWNQRAEPTCKVVERYKDKLGDWVVFRCGHTDIWKPYLTTCPWCHGRLVK